MDCKATVKIGEFSRGGKNRVAVSALDHDFNGTAQSVTPVGLYLPRYNDFYMYLATSTVTSDCLVDVLESWWQAQAARFSQVRTLVINLDNGPENHSKRTQFMARMVEFAKITGLSVKLAYYPPYHSKYNPVERLWGALEQYWNGDLLDSLETVYRFARNMSWKGQHPTVEILTKTYKTGVTLTKEAMLLVEAQLQRLPGLSKWFVTIVPKVQDLMDT